MTQPLALDSAPHGEAGSWRRGEELIDALAYVDFLAPAERAAVDKLIAEEVRQRLCREFAQCFGHTPLACVHTEFAKVVHDAHRRPSLRKHSCSGC